MKLFKYHNVCDKTNFNQVINNLKNIKIYHIQNDNDEVSFYSNQKIDFDGVLSTNLLYMLYKKVIIPNIIFIFGIIVMFSIIYTTPNYIRSIQYEKDSIKDNVVWEYVENQVINNKNIDNLNELSKELSIKFSHYAFIEVYKRGSVIYINIEMEDTVNKPNLNDTIKGDFISKYDAYIEQIIIERGTVVTSLNTTVKKGDLLVSGNLIYNTNPQDKSQYVCPMGVIIGRVIDQKVYKIKKETQFLTYNGSFKKRKKYYLFNKSLNNTVYVDENSLIIENNIFNIKNILKITNEITYFKEKTAFTYDINTVKDYTESLIYYELEKNRVCEYEKIHQIKLLNIKETHEYFEVFYLVEKSVNLVYFKEIQ